MATPPPATPSSATAAADPAHGVHTEGAADLGELGRTTSSRSWVALAALLLVVIGFSIYGFFGTIPVQSTIAATVTNGSFPVEITAGAQGTIASLYEPEPGQRVVEQGTVIATIKPTAGGPDVSVTAPTEMGIVFQVVQGSPVETMTIIANGTPVIADNTSGKATVYAFLSAEEVQAVQTAEKLTVEATSPQLSTGPAPIAVSAVGTVPESQAHIAQLTGNTIYAENAYTAAGGAPYAVLFAYVNTSDADEVTGTADAEITVTQSSPHPFQLLFGS